MTQEQRDTDKARARDVCGLISGWTASQKIDRLAVEFAIVRAEATREAIEAAADIADDIAECEGGEIWVASRIARKIRALAAAPAAREEGK